jgi:aminoglycoside 2'-N-acetyltransferase I
VLFPGIAARAALPQASGGRSGPDRAVDMTRLWTVASDGSSSRVLEEVRELLEQAFDGEFDEHDWQHTLGGWHVVAADGPRPVAHAAVVPRDLRVAGRAWRAGYVEAVATAPDHRGAGLGSRVMTRLAAELRAGFELGALSTGRHAFYERLGWERWQGPTYVRDGGTSRRTPEDDDGLMVLRFGPSRDLDLRAAISCEARPGDDW